MRDNRLRGCGKRRENKIKRQGRERERASRQKEAALSRGNRALGHTDFFFWPYPETCRTSTTRNHAWAPALEAQS